MGEKQEREAREALWGSRLDPTPFMQGKSRIVIVDDKAFVML
jgi:hypothetical protein